MKLKTLANFTDLDMKGIIENTVRLEVAGVKAVMKTFKAEMNMINNQGACSSRDQGACGRGQQMLLERSESLEETIAKLSFTQNPASTQHQASPASSTKGKMKRCWICQDTSHVVRKCPKRFCQACGGTGHDAWMKCCPKNS